MYRLQEIVNSFLPLVGWEQSRANAYKISEALTQSDSGLFYQEAHPLLTLRAMKGIMPSDWIEQYETFSPETSYSKGDIVVRDSVAYQSVQDNNTQENLQDTNWWVEYNILSDYLQSLSVTGIKQVIQRFIRDKVVGMESKNIIDRRTLFDGAGRIEARIQNKGRLCGFEITPIRGEGITTKLEKIGLQFTGNIGAVKVYLFHSSKREPVWSETLNYTKTNGTYQWFDLKDVFLPYISAETNAGGSWYLVYNQDELPAYMEGINFARDWSREPCSTCNRGDVQLYRMMSRYFQISPFCVDAPANWDETLWDIRDNIYTNTINYGINLQFSVGCDLTDIMIGERLNFASVIQLQVANNALRSLALNPEVSVNRVQANADRNNLLYELDGNGQAVKGLHGNLEKAYKALSFNTKGLSDVCLSCHNKGIRFGSI